VSNIFTKLLDRCLFTFSFIVGVQLPEFVQQYSQRLSGHLNEASHHLSQFQAIADSQYQGSLLTLISRYQANSDIAIVQTGDVIAELMTRIELFELQLSHLQQGDLYQRLYYFIIEMDIELARATAFQFQLAIPLETQALLLGACLALLILLMQSVIKTSVIYTINRYKHKNNRSLI